MILFQDTETYCDVPIRNGTHAYAEEVEITVLAWAIDDGPITVEDLTGGKQPSDEWKEAVALADEIVMHKSDFDRTVIRKAWGIVIPIERVHDTMVRAMAHSLPGSLDKLCDIMGVAADKAKDKEGKALIQLFCKPMPKNQKLRRATRETHPEHWRRFLAYAGTDISAMRELYKKLPRWNYRYRELQLWRLDQRVNDRGFRADVELAKSAISAVGVEQRRLKAKTQELTGGEVASATQRDQLLAHILSEYGVDLPDMKKDTLERRLADEELPQALRELIKVRLSATTSSTAKYAALMRAVSSDGRLRGSLQFAGALRTARWSGRLFQPQNMMRPDMSPEEIEYAIEAMLSGSADLLLDDVMRAAANIMRGMIIAGSGRKIISSDLKNIEGRIAAWLSGEQWKLQAFADYDAGTGADLYAMAYAKSFGVTPAEVMENYKAGGDWRQVGKVQELALGYEGGVGAFLAFAAVYRLDLEAMAAQAYSRLPDAARVQAEIMLGWRKKKKLTTFGLSDRAFVVCEAFKALWREAHSQTSSYWPELNKAAIRAVNNPGLVVECRRLKFKRSGAWLRMILPSGRSLCYPSPQVEDGKLSYMGVNQYTRKWSRLTTYGGKLFENACQAVARDVMAWNMPAIEEAGYEIILSVHDEIITETPDTTEFSHEMLSKMLSTNPPWADGVPLDADGFEAHRYRKD